MLLIIRVNNLISEEQEAQKKKIYKKWSRDFLLFAITGRFPA